MLELRNVSAAITNTQTRKKHHMSRNKKRLGINNKYFNENKHYLIVYRKHSWYSHILQISKHSDD